MVGIQLFFFSFWWAKAYTKFIKPQKVVFSYPDDIQRHSCVKNQVPTRKLTYARSPIVYVRYMYVGDYEVSLNNRGTTGSTFEVPSFELLLFLPTCYYYGVLYLSLQFAAFD